MKIAVIAANGRSGQAFVKEALNQGHKINAGVHSSNPFTESDNLKVFKGDATNKSDIKKLITGCDAVVSLIGHVKNSNKDVQTKTLENIISSMNELKIKRLVSLTGTGVRFPGDKISLIDKSLNLMVRTIMPDMIKDGVNTASIIKSSNLDWTIIRGLILTKGAAGPFALEANGPAKILVSRSEVALAALQVIDNKSFIKSAPIITRA